VGVKATPNKHGEVAASSFKRMAKAHRALGDIHKTEGFNRKLSFAQQMIERAIAQKHFDDAEILDAEAKFVARNIDATTGRT